MRDSRGMGTREEIHEQFHSWEIVTAELAVRREELSASFHAGDYSETICSGCGSSYYASLSSTFLIKELLGVRAQAVPGGASSPAGENTGECCPLMPAQEKGVQLYSNEQIAQLCGMSERLIGFCSVDPHRCEASAELKYALSELDLWGLKLSPPTQEFHPDDRQLAYPLYEEAQRREVPVVVHCGMTWEPDVLFSYGHPLRLEAVAHDFPELNIVIAHFGWP